MIENRLPHRGKIFILYLAFLSAFAPLSIDLFLPALPQMTANLHTYESLSSLSISGFLLLFALSMLVWGPLSDSYGRRPILFCGLFLYIVSSSAIALSSTIYPLLVWRAVQAVGSGAISAMSLAIVKDVFHGTVLEKVVTWIQTITILAPMLAPVLGAVILQTMDWRGIFWSLALCGLLTLGGACMFRETLVNPSPRSPLQSLGRVFVVLHNKRFTALLMIFSATCMPLMVYIATSSYIFQTMFHLTPQQYSAFFAFNASISLTGPLLHARFFRHWNKHFVLAGYMLLIGIAGILIMVFGGSSAGMFALLFAPVSLCTSAIRPPATVLMLNQLHGDSGTGTALINSMGLLLGSMAMFFCTLPLWPDFVAAAGCITFCIGALTLAAWLRLDRPRVLQAEEARP